MIRFERTRDTEMVQRIMTDRHVYPFIRDDFSPAADDYQPVMGEHVWYILVHDGEELLGLWALHPQNSVCWEIHTCLLPHAWGARASVAARSCLEWIWRNVPNAERVVTNVPAYNRLALHFAEKGGMEQYGVNPASFLHHGKLYDQIMLGISRPVVPRETFVDDFVLPERGEPCP